MRKVFGILSLALGAFLLAAAAMGQLWAPTHAARTPLEVNTTTRLAGTADKLDPTSGEVQNLDVKATSVTKSDSNHSDDDVVAFVSTTCLVIDKDNVPDCVDAKDPGKRLITASTDTFATDRRTAMATNAKKYNAADATHHAGLINKFPFNSQRKTYPFWDGMLGTTTDAVYKATDTVEGLRTYRYDVDVPTTAAEVVSGVQGNYTTDKSIWVEPRTGSIVKQTQHEVRTLENGDPLLDLDIAYTDQSVKAAVDEADGNARSLWLLTSVVPIAGLVLGLLLVVGGLALLRGGLPRRVRP